MAGRPPKTTVDYFPHDANASHSKTLFILQARFGNNGYAGWFKILELLCRTPGHAFSYSKPSDWQFLGALLAFPDREIEQFLNCLAELEAIDPDLYLQKILWCDNLITKISGAYAERKNQIPIKPPINAVPPPINTSQTNLSVVDPKENTGTKLNETKLNETEEDKPPTPLTPTGVSSASSSETGNDSQATRHVNGVVVKTFTPVQQSCLDAYQNNIGMATPIIGDNICLAIEDYTAPWVLDAIRESATHEKRSWAYVVKVLQTWKQQGRNNGQKGVKRGEIKQPTTSTTDIVQQGIDADRREAAKAAARAAGNKPKPGRGLPEV